MEVSAIETKANSMVERLMGFDLSRHTVTYLFSKLSTVMWQLTG